MTLLEVLNVANKGYPDGGLTRYFDPETGEPVDRYGDALAKFVVIEISETYEEGESDVDNLSRAKQVIRTAQGELEQVIEALTREQEDPQR
jgi:hypothetical protein